MVMLAAVAIMLTAGAIMLTAGAIMGMSILFIVTRRLVVAAVCAASMGMRQIMERKKAWGMLEIMLM
jgi:hypothetical protein